jgi:hypothetical protein
MKMCKSQSVLIMINPIIFARTRMLVIRAVLLLFGPACPSGEEAARGHADDGAGDLPIHAQLVCLPSVTGGGHRRRLVGAPELVWAIPHGY